MRGFCDKIGYLLLMAPCGRSSLYYLRKVSISTGRWEGLMDRGHSVFHPERTVERLDVAAVSRFSRPREVERHSAQIGQEIESSGDKLSARPRRFSALACHDLRKRRQESIRIKGSQRAQSIHKPHLLEISAFGFSQARAAKDQCQPLGA